MTMPFAVDLQDQGGGGLPAVGSCADRRRRCPGRFDDQTFGLPFALSLPEPPVDGRYGLVVGTADGLGDRKPVQAVEVPADGPGQLRVGGMPLDSPSAARGTARR
ncbi:hypothetical protein [Streptomyces sp. NPDC051677]|uniref:hypothetical protein n=1 Tax=Streptomyces sp. NPDC051677 TaxID=3365669 RepID=UPI0037D0A19D